MWFYIALLGYAFAAIVSILDKFILTKQRVQPKLFVFYSTVFLLPLLFVIPFLAMRPNPFEFAIILLAAFGFVSSLGAMYYAFLKTEVSHMGPFIGGMTTLFILILGQLFLHEQLVNSQLFGIFLLSVGTLIIGIPEDLFRKNWQQGVDFALFSSLLFSVFHVSAKYTYSHLGFGAGSIYLWSFIGLLGSLTIFSREVRDALFPKRTILSFFKNLFQKKNTGRELTIIYLDKILAGLYVILIQYAVSIGSVTKVNAVAGAQYAFLIILVVVLSYLFPRLFGEKYQKNEIAREVGAVLIIAAGLAMLVK